MYDASLAQHMALQLWDFSASLHKSEFERVMDLALACMLLDQVDDRGAFTAQHGATYHSLPLLFCMLLPVSYPAGDSWPPLHLPLWNH